MEISDNKGSGQGEHIYFPTVITTGWQNNNPNFACKSSWRALQAAKLDFKIEIH